MTWKSLEPFYIQDGILLYKEPIPVREQMSGDQTRGPGGGPATYTALGLRAEAEPLAPGLHECPRLVRLACKFT